MPIASASTATSAVSTGVSAAIGSLPKKPRSGTIVILLMLVAIAAGIYFWWRPSATVGNQTVSETESTLPLETFIVNLDGSGQRAYLRIGITLGLSHPLPGKKEELPIARLRDAILSVLSTAQPAALLAAPGKEKLKADLLKSLQERLPELGIDNVYFTEFLVQM
jgi:flagellar basal body-associated protein FliL